MGKKKRSLLNIPAEIIKEGVGFAIVRFSEFSRTFVVTYEYIHGRKPIDGQQAMDKIEITGFKLIGLKLNHKTTNEGGQSSIDCGNLWQKFEKEHFAERIPNKLDEEIYAVYFEYEGDHTQPFSYFIGCKVKMDTAVPQGMDGLLLPTQNYAKVIAKGKMPECVSNAWKSIWASTINRTYKFDFEKYDERSKDWSNAEVEIYVSAN
ncbi:MAG TPA: GyrI-like domain-containing protein [Cyclobacteriaceae bacterium]|nr:GyrI-like domain-containing protein [Cyclobacteriaceae bacterium]